MAKYLLRSLWNMNYSHSLSTGFICLYRKSTSTPCRTSWAGTAQNCPVHLAQNNKYHQLISDGGNTNILHYCFLVHPALHMLSSTVSVLLPVPASPISSTAKPSAYGLAHAPSPATWTDHNKKPFQTAYTVQLNFSLYYSQYKKSKPRKSTHYCEMQPIPIKTLCGASPAPPPEQLNLQNRTDLWILTLLWHREVPEKQSRVYRRAIMMHWM